MCRRCRPTRSSPQRRRRRRAKKRKRNRSGASAPLRSRFIAGCGETKPARTSISNSDYNSPTMSKSFMPTLTRRQALEALGIGATAAAIVPSGALAQEPSFPKGAIIRTLLKDVSPEELAGGATLFHEHMQLAPDFNVKFGEATAAARAANGLPPIPGRGGAAGKGPAAPKGPDIMRYPYLMAAEARNTKSPYVALLMG